MEKIWEIFNFQIDSIDTIQNFLLYVLFVDFFFFFFLFEQHFLLILFFIFIINMTFPVIVSQIFLKLTLLHGESLQMSKRS